MKFYIILLFVMFVTIMHTKAEASVHIARNIKQVFSVPYSSRILRFLPLQRCSTNNIFIKCPSRTQTPHEHLSYDFNGVRDKSKINYNQKYTPIHDKIQAYNGRRTSERNTSPIVNAHQVIKNLKSNLKNSISLVAADITKRVQDFAEKTKHVENLYNVVNIVKVPPEKAETMDENAANAHEEKTNYDTRTNINVGKDFSIELKNEGMSSQIRATPKNQTNLDAQNDFKSSLSSALNQFEQQLYLTNFMKFLSLTPASKGDSGMSFVQSGLFAAMSLAALSTEVDLETKNEIDQHLAFNVSDLDKVELIRQVMSSLPNSSEGLKFRWSSRLVLRSGRQLSQDFITGTAQALQLKIDHFEDAQTPQAMAQVLNRMIEEDSGGAIHDTFEEEDLSENEEAVLITTLYFRACWRTAPTLLNGTWLFRDSGNAPSRTIKMIRINDIMKYLDLPEWDAEAIEIPYQTEGLSLLMLVPRNNSLKRLVEHVTDANLTSITERMQSIHAEASLPLYTLRMTLLLPNKLQAMGLPRIVNVSKAEDDSLRISQAAQRIMFYAEAGRNAYKDDGLQWDAAPEMIFLIDRPYMFYVRWQDFNLVAGNFVL